MALSFNLQGSNAQDQTNVLDSFLSKFSGSTPTSSALSSASQPNYFRTLNPTPKPSAPAAAPAPTTPVKSTTRTNVDGSIDKTEYHSPSAPASPPNSAAPFSGVTQGGLYGAGAGYTAPNTTNNPNPPAVPTAPADNTSTYAGLINRAATSAGGSENIGNKAAEIAASYGKQIADVGGQGARAQAGYLTTGTTPVAEGNAAVIAQTTAKQQQALAEGGQLALQGTAQQLTGQQNQTSGILGAAGLAAPTGAFPFVFDPTTGSFKTPSGTTGAQSGAPTLTYNPQTDANNLASLVIANKVPFADAVSALGYAGTVGKGLLTTAIAAQGGDLTKIQAQNAVTQSNITTAGTTATNAAAALYAQTYPELQNIKQTTSNIDQFGNLLINNMQNLNPTDFKLGNKTIGEFRNALSSPQQAQFDTTFSQLKAQIANLLSSGGAQIPTQITADSNKIIDGSAPIGTLAATLQRIQTEGNILTSNIQQKLNTAGSAIGAPTVGTNNNPAGI